MPHSTMMRDDYLSGFLLATLLSLASAVSAQPLFDVHLHYHASQAAMLSPKEIVERLERNDIRYAVVSGTPESYTRTLHRHAPERIIPFLSAALTEDDKTSWISDSKIVDRLISELDNGGWEGIGELHVFAEDRNRPTFRRIIEIASERKLPVLLHCDPAVIDTVYEIAADSRIIWAHAGTFPYPDLIADYLKRYPRLSIDLSMRDERIAADGEIEDAWYELLLKHPDRFMIGVDTYSISRWQDFDSATSTILSWLSALPDEVARQIGHDNAARLFEKTGK